MCYQTRFRQRGAGLLFLDLPKLGATLSANAQSYSRLKGEEETALKVYLNCFYIARNRKIVSGQSLERCI